MNLPDIGSESLCIVITYQTLVRVESLCTVITVVG